MFANNLRTQLSGKPLKRKDKDRKVFAVKHSSLSNKSLKAYLTITKRVLRNLKCQNFESIRFRIICQIKFLFYLGMGDANVVQMTFVVTTFVVTTFVLKTFVLITFVLITFNLTTSVLTAFVLTFVFTTFVVTTFVLKTFVLITFVLITFDLTTSVLTAFVLSTFVLAAFYSNIFIATLF